MNPAIITPKVEVDEFCWKNKNGELIPLNKLTPTELNEALKESTKNSEKMYNKFMFWEKIRTELGAEFMNRLVQHQEALNKREY